MPLALALITVSAWLLYSGLKGVSLTDVLAGATGSGPLDPAGGGISAPAGSSQSPTGNTPGGSVAQGISSGTPKQIIDSYVLPLAKADGMITGTTPTEVENANALHGPTITGGRSDHQGPPDVAWAADMSNGHSPTPQMDKLAQDLANRFSIPWKGSGAVSKTIGHYRYQLIYRSYVGGNHYNHVHFGVKAV